MSGIDRRQFGRGLAAGLASAVLPPAVLGGSAARVVVLGGGAGGASAAQALARGAGGRLEVTLIESAPRYTSCFYSNIHVGGLRDFASITHGYERLAAREGVTVVHERALAIEREAKRVRLADGRRVPYDRLIVSPGIDLVYESVPGYSEAAAAIAPHAWRGGAQTALLKAKLDALENGQDIVMIAPPNPYRCPPGPYERASMMAHVLSARGHTDSTITILDTKPGFSKQALFVEGWNRYYGDMIAWYPPEVHGGIVRVDAEASVVETDLDTFEGALLNIIPAQRAAAVAVEAALADESGFCPVEADSMRSRVDASIFVIGDASIAGAMPKSAFSANSQARIAAMHVRGDLLGERVPPAEYANTCWSLIAPGDSVKVGARYRPGADGRIVDTASFISAPGEDAARREATWHESRAWYAAITNEMFG